MSTIKAKGAALITGGAKRIGQAIAFTLSELGYAIALHYQHSTKEAKITAQKIRSQGQPCELFPCDLTNEIATQKLIADVKRKFSNFNVLVNNASIFEKSDLKNYSLSSLNRHFIINFVTPYVLIAEFARLCKIGNIINILDTHIVDNTLTHFDYLLSKKSLAELTKMSAVALAPNIRVNGIAPGLILPPQNKGNRYLTQLARNIPIKHKGDIKNITSAVKFLLENEFLVGHIVMCDGGEHLL